jgi:two-component system alkaline phosphatase synthesis response regulator PhoP
MHKILLVDDEPDIVEVLKYNLEKENYTVIEAYSGKEALEQLNRSPDLILLDIMLPDMSGFEVCTEIKEKEQHRNIPIIFLTALSSELDEVKGLGLGAVDYITKPISPKKLSARVKSNLRFVDKNQNVQSGSRNEIELNGIQIDSGSYKVFIEEKEVFFPRKEFGLLYFLASHQDRVFPRETLLDFIWGEDTLVVDRTIDVHIRKIRQKLGKYANHIQTIKGVGYKFISEIN